MTSPIQSIDDDAVDQRMMFSKADLAVFDVFRGYLVTAGEMLCFHGNWFDEHKESLRHLTAEKLLTQEQFKGGYSLTRAGFAALQRVRPAADLSVPRKPGVRNRQRRLRPAAQA